MGIGRWVKRILGLAFALLLCAGLWWLRPAPADSTALAVIDGSAGSTVPSPAPTPDAAAPAPAATGPLAVSQNRNVIELQLSGTTPTKGFIFYPGALVDPRAYANILAPIASAGYLVAIVKTPYDLPITDISAADGVINSHPEVTWWGVGGHSLGGVAASTFASGGPSKTPALVLWGSYPVSDLSGVDGLSVLSVSGTNDGLTTPSDVEASKAKLPADAQFVAVDGSVHSFFGDYGEQSGDGTPTISRAEAQAQIVNATLQWLNSASALA